VLTTLRRIADRGALETAARTKQFIRQAIRYGIATGREERDVTQDLRGATTKKRILPYLYNSIIEYQKQQVIWLSGFFIVSNNRFFLISWGRHY
jgi:hypothetical protein